MYQSTHGGKPRIDRSSPAYKREMWIVLIVVVTLTVLGGALLGMKISSAEEAKQSGEMQKALEQEQGKVPGPEHGVMQ